MNKENVKLSIIMPVYNLEKYLPKCLDTLVNQTLQEIEILCIDEGSTDSTTEIISRYAEKYPDKISIFNKQNEGEYASKNYGLEKTNGEYVTFANIDNYVELNWAEKLYATAKENDADMVVCAYEKIDINTHKVIDTNIKNCKNNIKEINTKDDFMLFINSEPWNKIYKSEKIKELKFLPISKFEDILFLMNCYTKIKKIAFVEDILCHYFFRNNLQKNIINYQDVEDLKKYLLEVKTVYVQANKYDEMKYILDTFVFLQLCTYTMYEMSYDKTVDINVKLKETIKYLDINFENWRKSPFLSIGYSIKKGFKHIALWWIALLYKCNLPIIYIKVYSFFMKIHNKIKNIKWNI